MDLNWKFRALNNSKTNTIDLRRDRINNCIYSTHKYKDRDIDDVIIFGSVDKPEYIYNKYDITFIVCMVWCHTNTV